ncbi:MAG: tetratricopeptide repeat protein, partial [Pseudomonadota bacterium]
MNHSYPRLVLLSLSFFFFLSCSQLQKKDDLKKAPNPVVQQLETAKKQYKGKRYSDAATTLNKILKFYRSTDIGDDALFLLAKTYSRLEDWPKALNVYSEMYDSKFYSSREFVARTAAAKILAYQLQKPKEALRLIDRSLRMRPKKQQRAELLEVKFSALMKMGSQLEAFETLVELSQNHPEMAQRQSFKRKAKAFLDSRLSGPELKDFADDSSPGSDLKTDAMYRYGVILMGEGKYDQARSYLQGVVDIKPKSYVA